MNYRPEDFREPPRALPADGSPGDAPAGAGSRPRYRPPIGIPAPIPEVSGWRGAVGSFLLHALVIAVLLAPLVAPALLPEILNEGAGGPGPAGGGGGGRGGSGGQRLEERLRYIEVTPAPVSTPSILPPLVPPPPEEKKPEPEKAPVVPQVDIRTDANLDITAGVIRGIGGGTGNDGSAGSGPGSGGGVGSGVGTGRGSSTGPGTGGGPGDVYPPSPTNMVLPPMDLPQKYRPYNGKAYFDVDERGNAILIAVVPSSRDRGFDRRLRDRLLEYKFRPATRATDGVPVRDTVEVGFEVP